MATKLITSEQTEEILKRLNRATNLSFVSLARLALSLSILKNGKKVPKTKDIKGKEFNKYSLMGEYEDFYRSVLTIAHGKKLKEDEFYSSGSFTKFHIDAGGLILKKIYKEKNRDPNEFLAEIFLLMKSPETKEVFGEVVKPLDLEVGEKLSGEKVIFELNKATNPHMGLMGTTGCGKTQFLLNILYDIKKQSDYQTNFIFFDYKGEFLDKEGNPASDQMAHFIDETKAEIFQLPSDTFPINPFVLGDYKEENIKMSAEEKAKSFSSIEGKFGVVQRGNLVKAIRIAYKNRENQELKYPDLQEVYSIVREIYENKGKKEDTLTEVMRQLSEFSLFWEHETGDELIKSLIDRTIIVDLSKLPVLKELVGYLVIEQLYREMSRFPDSAIKEGYRQIRMCLVIDEAHYYLPQKNIFLQRIIREGRSKGIAVFLASQSPKDYSQRFFDFKEFLEFPIIMKSKGISKKALRNLLGVSDSGAKTLLQKIPNLDTFQIITRAKRPEEEYLFFTGQGFYKRF